MLIRLCALLVICSYVSAHQSQNFPGQNAQQPPQVHHQQQAQAAHGQQHAQPAGAHQNPAHAQEFGGASAQDAGHIKEHLDGKVDPSENMTPEQLQFHYFNMHDLDKNGKLDGVELLKAITHFHNENPGPQHQNSVDPIPLPSEVELETMIDSILREDDFDGDGLIDYGEFLKAQQLREDNARVHQQQMAAQAAGHQQNPPPQQAQQHH